jgi:hypothetical protein
MESTVASLPACPQCGALNRPRLQFCLSCGGRLWTPPGPELEERRPQTVLEKIEAAKKEVESEIGPLTIAPTASASYIDRSAYAIKREPAPRSRKGWWAAGAVALVMLLVGSWLFAQYASQSGKASPGASYGNNPQPAQTTPIRAVAPTMVIQEAPPQPPAAPQPAPPLSLADMAGQTTDPSAEIPGLPVPPPEQLDTRGAAAKKPPHRATKAAKTPAKVETPVVAPAPAAPVVEAPPPAPAKAEPTVAQRVAQCRQLGVFERQSCLWALCSGSWGKGGCPAYQSQREP